MIIDLFLYDAEVLRVRYRMCDELNSMQIIQESSILLDRTPTTFKLQWRFNFQLLGPVLRRDAFFRAKRTFCAEVQALCVQLSSKWWERSTDKIGGQITAELSMALSAHQQTFILSARRFPTDTESEGGSRPRTCILYFYRPRAERCAHRKQPRRACVVNLVDSGNQTGDFVWWQSTESETEKNSLWWRAEPGYNFTLSRLKVNST